MTAGIALETQTQLMLGLWSKCGKPMGASQVTCELPVGHSGNHENGTWHWHGETFAQLECWRRGHNGSEEESSRQDRRETVIH